MLLLRFPRQFDRKKKCQLSIYVILFLRLKILNPGQITRPSINTTAILKGKSDKDFKKVVYWKFEQFWGAICLKKVRRRFMPFVSKIQNPVQITHPSIDMIAVLKGKSDKDFEKVVSIWDSPSYNSQCLLFWRNFTPKMQFFFICTNFFLSNWCGNLKSNIEMFYKAVWFVAMFDSWYDTAEVCT